MSTMNPEEIRALPMRRDLPLNGLSEAQTRAIGLDPQEVETSRLAQNEWAAQQRINEDAELVLAAQQAVADGNATYAEAAQALLAAGRRDAHDAVVQMWHEEESWYGEQDAVDALAYLDVNEYIDLFNTQQQRERVKTEAEIEQTKRQIAQAQVKAIQDDLKDFVGSVPGAHEYAPQVEHRLVENLKASGVLPSTPEERATAIESALRETAVLGDATESIRQQVDQEWRIHRRNNGARDGLMTAANIADAEAHWKNARTKQLADNKMIALDDLKPGPTAEEQTAALTEKYRAKQETSTSHQQNVADMNKRGKEAAATRDRGEGITADRKAYKEAYARAEAEAQYGTVESGYGPEAVQETPAAKDSGLPEGWVDEFGPGLLGTLVSDA
jgi:hypothetical protein